MGGKPGGLQACWVAFGELIIYFNEPVKVSVVPDYYNVIKEPRDMGTIKKKLQRKQYDSPQQFYDVRAPALVSVPLASCPAFWAHQYLLKPPQAGPVVARTTIRFTRVWMASEILMLVPAAGHAPVLQQHLHLQRPRLQLQQGRQPCGDAVRGTLVRSGNSRSYHAVWV